MSDPHLSPTSEEPLRKSTSIGSLSTSSETPIHVPDHQPQANTRGEWRDAEIDDTEAHMPVFHGDHANGQVPELRDTERADTEYAPVLMNPNEITMKMAEDEEGDGIIIKDDEEEDNNPSWLSALGVVRIICLYQSIPSTLKYPLSKSLHGT
jgi:hypothetical protein